MDRNRLRILLAVALVSTLILTLSACRGTELAGVRVALVVSERYMPDSVNIIRNTLRRQGATVVIVGAEKGKVNYFSGTCQSVTISEAIRDLSVDDFDAVYVADAAALSANDGPLKADYVYEFLRAFAATGKPMAGVDRGATLLLKAGVLSGKSIANGIESEETVTTHGARMAEDTMAKDGGLVTATKDSLRSLNSAFTAKLAGQ